MHFPKILYAAFLSLAVTPVAAFAQPAKPATLATRFLSVETLSAPPPAGLAEWATAARQLDEEFRPRLDVLDRLPAGADATRQRDELSAAYDARNRDLFAPLVLRLRAVAKRYAVARKLPDLRLLTADQQGAAIVAGARDVTADFVAWAAQHPTG